MQVQRTNESQNTVHVINDLDDEEMALLHECMNNIRKHVDRNIAGSKDAGQLARLVIFRRLLTTGKY